MMRERERGVVRVGSEWRMRKRIYKIEELAYGGMQRSRAKPSTVSHCSVTPS